ncbi:unnamed protein product [Cylindrotheca closterium]|uniref:Uncharacterized protein n=1 Tax=Cylindrotheca closterium TaxID=2856 RepID=A0AAD2CVH8_9STRA|nr:unnamed protein product [Cylindrotheca closterium]
MQEDYSSPPNNSSSSSSSGSFLYTGSSTSAADTIDARHIIVDQTVSRIGYSAFHSWESVVAVYLPQGLRSIGARSFEECTCLATINIPGSVLLIGISAFEGCIRLMTVGLAQGIAEIGPHAFAECRSLKQIEIPSSVEKIGNSAFEHCVSLKEIGLADTCTALPYNVFKDCLRLQETFLPPTTDSIGSGAYMNCERIVFLNLPPGLEHIFCYCFVSCTALKNIHIPSSVKVIDYEAFRGCTSLLSVEIPAKVESIGDGAFLSCRSLCHVALSPEMDTSVFDDGVFENCDKLIEMFPGGIVKGLKERFAGLPVHQLCCNQSFCQYQREKTTSTLENLNQVMMDAGKKETFHATDQFGMNPFHILALASELNTIIFQELLKRYPIRCLSQPDQWGMSPIYFLSLHASSNATTLLHMALQETIPKRLQDLGLLLWRQDVDHYLQAIQLNNPTYRVRQIGKLFHKLVQYERVEALSLLEEALWRMKLQDGKNNILEDDGVANYLVAASVDAFEAHRDNCRISCGSDIVISNVLPFLQSINPGDYAWSV